MYLFFILFKCFLQYKHIVIFFFYVFIGLHQRLLLPFNSFQSFPRFSIFFRLQHKINYVYLFQIRIKQILLSFSLKVHITTYVIIWIIDRNWHWKICKRKIFSWQVSHLRVQMPKNVHIMLNLFYIFRFKKKWKIKYVEHRGVHMYVQQRFKFCLRPRLNLFIFVAYKLYIGNASFLKGF